MSRLSVVIFCALLVFVQSSAPPHSIIQKEETAKAVADIVRLPTTTKPTNYDISLTTNIHAEDLDFTGTVVITLDVVTATNKIVLHYRQLTINVPSVTLTNAAAVASVVTSVVPKEDDSEFLEITLEAPLAVGVGYVLTISYSGTLREDNAGFYSSFYFDKTGKKIWLATTQFESTDARHAFPCYDEPALKATFDLKITHGENYYAYSNMKETRGVPDAVTKMVTTTFDKLNVPMSTYLLAFFVSDFKAATNTVAKVNQRVFAREDAIPETGFALESGVKILEALEKYLDYAYEFTKMDQVAVPDFAAGAMENWGLVTYREEYLLSTESTAKMSRQNEKIATIVAHEYAHQWFGNLITPTWWSSIWLNEGFATFFEYYGTELAYPEFKMMELFITNLQSVMVTDSTGSARAMTVTEASILTPTQISNLFDTIAYAKSGCVIRMMHSALTDATFKNGITQYLNDKKHSDAWQADLFNNLQKAVTAANNLPSGQTVNTIWSTWSEQSGYPILNVAVTEENLEITQKRYFLTKPTVADPSVWWIPINFAVQKTPVFTDTKPQYWLRPQTLSEKIPLAEINLTPKDDWYIINKQQTGYYRVNYDEDNWSKLIAALKGEQRVSIHHINRAQLVDDAFNLARSGDMKYTRLFDLLQYLPNEDAYLAWNAANSGYSYLNRMFYGAGFYANLQRFIREGVQNIYKAQGVSEIATEENYLNTYLRVVAINLACSSGDDTCKKDVAAKLKAEIDGTKVVESNLRTSVYCNAYRVGGVEVFNYLFKKLHESNNQAERTLLINALGCSDNAELLKKYLDSSILVDNTLVDGVKVFYRIQERNRVLTAAYANGPAGIEAALTFMADNHAKIQELYMNGESIISSTVSAIAQRVVADAHKTKVQESLTKLQTAGVVTEAYSTGILASIATNNAWADTYNKEITDFLADYYNGASTVVVSTMLISFAVVLNYLFN